MGYTHYFEQLSKPTEAEWVAIVEAGKILLNEHHVGLDPEECQIDLTGIYINGDGDDGHETFHVSPIAHGFNFCKTARKPYDVLVVALLLVMHYHAPNVWGIQSDGGPDDWSEASKWAGAVLGLDLLIPPGVTS